MYGYVIPALAFLGRRGCNRTNHFSIDIKTKAFFTIQFRRQELCFYHFFYITPQLAVKSDSATCQFGENKHDLVTIKD